MTGEICKKVMRCGGFEWHGYVLVKEERGKNYGMGTSESREKVER
jgi:hypothetical protein